MNKKILIFGGGGFVGGNLAAVAHQNAWDVCIATHSIKPGLNFIQQKTINITQLEHVDAIIADFEPQVVVNLAAMAAIDEVEKERELAWQVNVGGAKNVAKNCARRGIRHIYFSSDAVFDGKASSYAEDSLPNPLNYYGYTKVEAEKGVLKSHPDSVVVRISLVLGFPLSSGNSFFAGLETKLKYGKDIPTPKEEVRTPVDVITLSESILELAESNFFGILHIGSTDFIDRFALTRKIAQKMGYDEEIVVLPDPMDFQLDRAPRHKNGIIAVTKAQNLLTTRLLSVDEGIQRAFDDRISSVEVQHGKTGN